MWGTGNALSGMASALATGDTGEPERLLDQAMPVLRQAGPCFLTWALYVRAIVAVRRGNADEAAEAIGRTKVRPYVSLPTSVAPGTRHSAPYQARSTQHQARSSFRTGR